MSTSNTQAKFSESYYQTRANAFSEFTWNIADTFRELLQKNTTQFLQLTSNTTDILKKLLVKNTTHCSRVYIKKYWHFQRVPSRLNYSKNFFPEFISQNTKALTKLLLHNVNLFRARISCSIHTHELLPNNSEHVFESFNEHLNRENILKLKIFS